MWNIANEYIVKLINTLEEGNLEIFNSSAEATEAMAIYDAGCYFHHILSLLSKVNQNW